MSEILVIHLPYAPDGPARWVPVDRVGRAMGSIQSGALTAAAAMASSREVWVLVPSESIFLASVSLPGLRGRRLRQALPFALEDRLIDDVENLHFAVGTSVGDNAFPVAVVARTAMDAFMEQLAAAGIRPTFIFPDCQAVALSVSGPVAVSAGDRVLFRDDQGGFACPLDLWNSLAEARGIDSGILVPLPREGLLGVADFTGLGACVNLLQGDYQATHPGADLGRWRLPLILAGAWAFVWMGGWLIELQQLNSEQRARNQEIAQLFHQLVPDEPMVDPRLQVERRLGRTSAAPGELLTMLAIVGDGLAAVSTVEISSVSYRIGSLEISIVAQRAEQVEQLRETMQASGPYAVGIDGASSSGDRIEARLVVRTGGAR